ncbi:MAG: FAD:protein FMN transferase [Candidatus Abyssobacteria bacterium SURF_5]|uniref:FAD:protein FMN transferase n=1 Tax=Abyssobacteria bacterium (strain SURF_5) TaxID=2093360 RepID=A0A3A4NP68_ABYX5|nr:MAG: FAD:protein FMN transferase [Candidatus Abyssubacteria bacterium SURF_5]
MVSVPIFRKKILILILVVVAIILVAASLGGSRGNHRYEQQAEIMGTVFTITIEGPGDHKMAAEAAFDEIRRIDRLLSTYKPDSEISKVNRLAAHEPVAVGQDFLNVLTASRIYFDMTGGAFDPSIKPLMDVWKEAKRENRTPAETDLRRAADLANLSNVTVDRSSQTVRFLKEGMALDFGGIAKGYAADRAIEILKTHGIERAILDAGGNFYALGTPLKKPHWEAGVRHPLVHERVIIRFPVSDAGVATSGSYERFFEIGGKKYSHIINPETGQPVEGMLSATVVAEDALSADALSTSVFVLGQQDGMRLIEELEGVLGILIWHEPGSSEDFKISVSSGLKDKLELLIPAE